MVWPLEIPLRGALESDRGQLGNRLLRILLQVPANRIGSYQFTVAQLKTIQEIITLSIFPVLSVFYLGDNSNGITASALLSS
jgi:uncharacterized protein (DUF486 family)